MNNKHISELYYIAMNNKDIAAAASYFHTDINLKTPMSSATGKDNVTAAASNFLNVFETLEVREVIVNGEKAIVIYDLHCTFGNIAAASFIKCKDDLISSIELFYDTKPFLN